MLRTLLVSLSTVSAAALLSTSGAHAQDATVEEAVVTMRGIEQTLPSELRQYGHDVETITETQIRNGGHIDISSALQMQAPGLFVSPGSGPFDYVDVSLQGSRTGDVLWLVDGVRVNNRIFNDTSPDALPANMVERIEILKGGESLFYGTQGVAGAINIVTRDFSSTYGGQFSAGYDTNNSFTLDGWARGAAGKHKFVGWANHAQSSGFQQFDTYQPSATDRKRGYEVTSFGGKYGYDFTGDLRLSLMWIHTEAKLDNNSPARTRESYNNRDEDIGSARLDYTPEGPVQLSLKGYFHDWDTTYANIQNSPTVPGRVVVIYPPGTYWGYKDYGASALAKLKLNRGFDYFVGYDYQNYTARDDVFPIAGQTEKVHAFFGQVRTNDDLSDKLKLAAGVRYNDARAANATVWNVSGRYEFVPEFYVEGSVATAFLLPSAEQLYYVGFPPDDYVGNPNLQPESSENINASVGGRLFGGPRPVTWQLTGFRRNIDNLIDIGYDNPAFPNGRYENVGGEVRVRGFEAQLIAPIGQAFSLNASYTHAQSRNQGSNLQRPRTPKDFAKATLSYDPPNRPFGAGVALNWVGDTYQSVGAFGRNNLGDYVVVDLNGYVFLDGQARKHRIGLRAQNLFDKNYATRLGQAQRDTGGNFLFRRLGVPQTVYVNYSYAF